MTLLYAESSAVLAWLLEEPDGVRAAAVIDAAPEVATSVITLIEVKRALVRLQMTEKLKEAARQRAIGILEEATAGWRLVEVIPEIQLRASEKFPMEPLGTLDALHLATALELLKIFPEVQFLTLDKRLRDNLVPLGLPLAIE